MKQIVINKNDEGQRLDAFLGKLLKDAPKSLIYKWIRKKRLKVNGKKCEISYRLKEGDTLSLYINDEFFSDAPAPLTFKKDVELKVVYEDENILIADKKKGLSSQPDKNSNGESLVEYIRSYLFYKGEYNPEAENTFAPQLCHRIDKNTEGLVTAFFAPSSGEKLKLTVFVFSSFLVKPSITPDFSLNSPSARRR